MELGPHAAFIEVAYAAAAVVVTALTAWVTIDYRRQKRHLENLEARGVTRRSERGSRATS